MAMKAKTAKTAQKAAPTNKATVASSMKVVQKQLNRFRTDEELLFLARRIFQKEPSIIEDLEERIEDVAVSQRGPVARHYILNTIEGALTKKLRNSSNGDRILLPSNAESYVSFCDLAEISCHSDRKVWHTFVLQDMTEDLEALHGAEGELPLFKMRKQIKKRLCSDDSHMASVQMEVQSLTDTDMVFFRIATIKKTKNEAKDERRMLDVRPTYLVYFPGEPYFFTESPHPNPDHCQAIVDALGCTAYDSIPLTGRHLESLRQLRANRDNPEKIGDEELWLDENAPLPILNQFTVSAVNPLRDEDQEMLLDDFTCTVELKGPDVLNGLRQISDFSSQNIVTADTPPSWLRNAGYRGRNYIHIKPKGKLQPKINARKSRIFVDMDEMSVVGSDLTMVRRRR